MLGSSIQMSTGWGTVPAFTLGGTVSGNGQVINDLGNLFLREAANAAADISAQGQSWVKNDTPNTPYFTDDTGIDRQIVTADYAGIFIEGNSGATVINVQHGFEQIAVFATDMPEAISNGDNSSDSITIGATGVYRVEFHLSALGGGTNKVYEITAFKLASSGSAITSTTEGTPVSVLATAHGFTTSNRVKLTGIATATILNNRIFKVTRTDNNNFTLQEDNGGAIVGTSFGTGSGGTATLATMLDEVHADRKWAANDVGQASGGGLVSFTKDDILNLFIKNITDTTNITVETCQFFLQRVS